MAFSNYSTFFTAIAFILLLYTQLSHEKEFPLNYGGLSLSENGNFYEITTKECPGGIFLTRPVNETCLCYHGIFAIVRECCTESKGLITTETMEWRRNFQCGISPEIKAFGVSPFPIRAILPLTKATSPFKPLLTFVYFNNGNFVKWRKFDMAMLAAAPNPVVFKQKEIEIINIRRHQKEIRFRMGEFGDVDVCYVGWIPHGPQTVRISIFTHANYDKSEYCCFQLDQKNVPGIIHSPCRGGSILTEIFDIESVTKGNTCPSRGFADRTKHLMKQKSLNVSPPKELMLRLKRQDDTEIIASVPEVTSESDSSPSGSSSSQQGLTLPIMIRYPISDLEQDSFPNQHTKLRIFNIIRNKGFQELSREPTTQRFILLKKSFQLFSHVVPQEMVPLDVTEAGFESFFFLFEGYDVNVERLTSSQFQRVIAVLEQCKDKIKPWSGSNEIQIQFNNGTCPRKASSFTVMNASNSGKETIEIPMPLDTFQFDPLKTDIIVDMNWKFVDFVKTICFDMFNDDFNSNHFYARQMQTLFGMKMVQERWFRNTGREGADYSKGIITNVHKLSRMVELDKALGIAHYISRNHEYFERPSNQGLIPILAIYKEVKKYEEGVRLKEEFLKKLEGYENGDDDVDFGEEDYTNTLNLSSSTPEFEGDTAVDRRKKNIPSGSRHGQKHSSNSIIKVVKPGDTIWDGVAICLDAKSNEDPAYYTEQDLWGTGPSLVHLGKIYPLS